MLSCYIRSAVEAITAHANQVDEPSTICQEVHSLGTSSSNQLQSAATFFVTRLLPYLSPESYVVKNPTSTLNDPPVDYESTFP